MPRPDVPLYQEGDRLVDAAGNVGYVRNCKGARGPYMRVYVTSGALKGTWHWPEKFAPPSLDWEQNGPRAVCSECEREFCGGLDECGLRRIFCRQCEAQQDAAERRAAQADAAAPSVSFRRIVTPAMRVAEEAAKDIERRRVGAEIDAEIASRGAK